MTVSVVSAPISAAAVYFLSQEVRNDPRTYTHILTFKIPFNSPPLVHEEGDVTQKVGCMVSNYSPRLSCSRREHWSGSITPPCPLLPPPLTYCCLDIYAPPLLFLWPSKHLHNLSWWFHNTLSCPPATMLTSYRIQRPDNLINTYHITSLACRRLKTGPKSLHIAPFSSVSSKFPHHLTFIRSSSADCKLNRSINSLTTHNNPVPFHFILPRAFKHIYVFCPLPLTTSVLLY